MTSTPSELAKGYARMAFALAFVIFCGGIIAVGLTIGSVSLFVLAFVAMTVPVVFTLLGLALVVAILADKTINYSELSDEEREAIEDLDMGT